MARGAGSRQESKPVGARVQLTLEGNNMKLDLLLDGEGDDSEVSGRAPRLFTTQLDPSKKLVVLSDAELAKVGGGVHCHAFCYQ